MADRVYIVGNDPGIIRAYESGGGGGPNPPQTFTPAEVTIHSGDTPHFDTNNAADFTLRDSLDNEITDPVFGSLAPDGDNLGVTYNSGHIGDFRIKAADHSDGGNSAEVVVHVLPAISETLAISTPFRAILYAADGSHKTLPFRVIRDIEWRDTRYGGWLEFSATLNLTLAESYALIAAGDLIEFWYNGTRRYRGSITSISREVEEPEVTKVQGYGISFRASKPTIDHVLLYSTPADISRAFSDLITEAVQPLVPNIVIDAQSVGATIQYVEGTYRNVGEVLNDLFQNQGENLGLWGGDADSDGNPRMYCKPFSSQVDWVIQVPGRNVTVAHSGTEYADIANRLTIQGARARYPNYIANPSFELPLFTGEDQANLLTDPGFEAGGTDWTGSGTVKDAGGGEGTAYNGTRMYETDTVGENAVQEQNPPPAAIVPGWTYIVAAQARVELDTTNATGKLSLIWEKSGGASIRTDSLSIAAQGGSEPAFSVLWKFFSFSSIAPVSDDTFTVTITGSPSGGTFTLSYRGQTTATIAFNALASAVQSALEALSTVGVGNVAVTGSAGGPYTVTFTAPDVIGANLLTGSGAGLTGGSSPGVNITTTPAAGFKVKIEMDGGGTGGGIHWDEITVFLGQTVYQDKWDLELLGTSRVLGLDWAYRDAVDGGFCLFAHLSAEDSDANEAHIQPLGLEKFNVKGGVTYNVGVYVKSPPGVSTNDKLRLEVHEFDNTGTETAIELIDIPAGAGWTSWTRQSDDILLLDATTQVYVRLTWRGETSLLVDGFSFRDSAAGDEFIRDGAYVTRIAVTDGALTGLSADALASITTYGVRDAVLQSDSITNLEDAQSLAVAYFNARAVAFPDPVITVVDDARFFRPGHNVRLLGTEGPSLMNNLGYLPIVDIGWRWDGKLTATMTFKREKRDLVSLFEKKVKRNMALWAGRSVVKRNTL